MASYDELEQAIEAAKQRLKSSPGDFADLSCFEVISYTDEELEEFGDQRDWVGQYVKGSVDTERGLTVLVAIDKHEGISDLADTIIHEIGHALWELLDEESRSQWQTDEESFADDLMFITRGDKHLATEPDFFLKLTKFS